LRIQPKLTHIFFSANNFQSRALKMNVDTISDFLAEQRDNAPDELQPLVLEFETLWERKLWHQLTNQLIEFFNNPGSAPQRLQFYKVFVLKFADKINQLKLVDLALKAATQCRGMY
jgi:26S proteasome regulatory subunit N9